MITTEKSAIGSEKNGSGSEKTTEKNAVGSEKTTEKIVRLMKANPYITNIRPSTTLTVELATSMA